MSARFCGGTTEKWRAYCTAAREHERFGRIDAAWACLEAGHIVGQHAPRLHSRSHLLMLGLAWRTRDAREVMGQAMRWAASLLITRLWVPEGNTGRSHVSAFQRMPIPRDLKE